MINIPENNDFYKIQRIEKHLQNSIRNLITAIEDFAEETNINKAKFNGYGYKRLGKTVRIKKGFKTLALSAPSLLFGAGDITYRQRNVPELVFFAKAFIEFRDSIINDMLEDLEIIEEQTKFMGSL